MFIKKNINWIIAIVLTLVIVVYQRATGPSYPIKGNIEINNAKINYKLLRTWGGTEDAKIEIYVPDSSFSGSMIFRRYKSNDEWTEEKLSKKNNILTATIPNQPPAGKVMYKIFLQNKNQEYPLTSEPVIIRFKGDVPAFVLIPHILLMFLAMLFSTRTGIEAFTSNLNIKKLTFITLVCLFIGGIILGPIVQKYAFGAFWTGWPFGNDLTDNKTVLTVILWFIAFYKVSRNNNSKWWIIAASITLIAIYLIPHSVLGSEIDYTKIPSN